VLCLRWYLRYPLSYGNFEEMMGAPATAGSFNDYPLGLAVRACAQSTYSIRNAPPHSVLAGG
jgi:hypothetical protein